MTAVEHCASLVDSDLSKAASLQLMKLGSWTAIACAGDSKLSQTFSVRSAVSGDGNSKATALYFRKARTHFEVKDALYAYLEKKNLILVDKQMAGIDNGFMYEELFADRSRLWVKYKIDTPLGL